MCQFYRHISFPIQLGLGTGMPYQTNFEVQLQIELVVHCSTQSEAPYESLLTHAIERYTLEPFSKEVMSVKSC